MSTDQDRLGELAAAYEGLEDRRSFPNREALEAYRKGLLDRTSIQAAFLAPRLGEQARVLEIGCGNGRLLVSLARRGSLERGLGIDLAESRVAFARRWAGEEGLDCLQFEVADALEFPLEAGSFTAAVCITGAFAYFDAFAAGSAVRLAALLYEALEPTGNLWLELYPHPEYRRLLQAGGRELRVWTELPPEDPWRFYLGLIELEDDEMTLTHTKTFIHRTTGQIDEGRRERLYLYTPDAIRSVLRGAGFTDVRLFEGWTDEPYRGGAVMVVVATRPAAEGPSPRLSEER
jgi:SAM-dependent methyltransferase